VTSAAVFKGCDIKLTTSPSKFASSLSIVVDRYQDMDLLYWIVAIAGGIILLALLIWAIIYLTHL